MASTKRVIKDSSLNNLRDLFEEEKATGMKIEDSDRYRSLYEHFFNKFEKENIKIILELIREGKDNDEIRASVIDKVTDIPKKESSKVDPVAEETEAIFILHEQKVVEVPNVDVIIGDSGKTTETSSDVTSTTSTEEQTKTEDTTSTGETESIFILHDKKVVDVSNGESGSETQTTASDKTDDTVSDRTEKKSRRKKLKETFDKGISVFKKKKTEKPEVVEEEIDPNAIPVSNLYHFDMLNEVLEELIKSADEILSA